MNAVAVLRHLLLGILCASICAGSVLVFGQGGRCWQNVYDSADNVGCQPSQTINQVCTLQQSCDGPTDTCADRIVYSAYPVVRGTTLVDSGGYNTQGEKAWVCYSYTACACTWIPLSGQFCESSGESQDDSSTWTSQSAYGAGC